jgi:hypothetical protein
LEERGIALPEFYGYAPVGAGVEFASAAAATVNDLMMTHRAIRVKTELLPKVEADTMAAALENLAEQKESDLASVLDKLWDLGRGDDANKQEEFRVANAFSKLVPFLQHPQKEIRVSALNLILKAIKQNDVNQEEFLAMEGIPIICSSLQHESGRVQIASINVMLVYTHRHEANQVRFRDGGGLPPLVSLLKSAHQPIREGVMKVVVDYAIRNDSTLNTDNLAVIWSLISPQRLVRLLSDSDAVSYDALSLLLTFIQSIEEQKASFIQAGGIQALVRLLGSHNPKAIVKAANGFRYLARIQASSKPNTANQDSIRKGGGIVALLGLLKHPDLSVCRQGVITLYYVVDSNKINQDMIRAAGGINKIVDLLQHPDPTVLPHALSALHFVMRDNTENVIASKNAGALEKLKIIRATQDGETQQRIDRVIALCESNIKANAHVKSVCEGKRPTIPVETPPEFADIMKRCWAQRVEDRPNFEKIESDLTACRSLLNNT